MVNKYHIIENNLNASRHAIINFFLTQPALSKIISRFLGIHSYPYKVVCFLLAFHSYILHFQQVPSSFSNIQEVLYKVCILSSHQNECNIYHIIKSTFSLTLFSTTSDRTPWLFRWIAKIIYSVKNISVYILNVSLFALMLFIRAATLPWKLLQREA